MAHNNIKRCKRVLHKKKAQSQGTVVRQRSQKKNDTSSNPLYRRNFSPKKCYAYGK
jgi:hypothetical protein